MGGRGGEKGGKRVGRSEKEGVGREDEVDRIVSCFVPSFVYLLLCPSIYRFIYLFTCLSISSSLLQSNERSNKEGRKEQTRQSDASSFSSVSTRSSRMKQHQQSLAPQGIRTHPTLPQTISL